MQVIAGKESKEMESQNQRDMRVHEAIYPRSSIPPKCNSCLYFYNFPFRFPLNLVQYVEAIYPRSSIKEKDLALDASSVDSMSPNPVPIISQPQLLNPMPRPILIPDSQQQLSSLILSQLLKLPRLLSCQAVIRRILWIITC